jgi:hypothetical protein
MMMISHVQPTVLDHEQASVTLMYKFDEAGHHLTQALALVGSNRLSNVLRALKHVYVRV